MTLAFDIDLYSLSFTMSIDGRPCFPSPISLPVQFEWMLQAIKWHLRHRGYNFDAVSFRHPFTSPPAKRGPFASLPSSKRRINSNALFD